jgi:hypothetical protein
MRFRLAKRKSPWRDEGDWRSPGSRCQHHQERGCPILAFFARVGTITTVAEQEIGVTMTAYIKADRRALVDGMKMLETKLTKHE